MNEPKPIAGIVADTLANYREEIPEGGGAIQFSWLGSFADTGWAIKIYPRLSEEQWRAYSRRANEAWDKEAFGYDATKALELLHGLFPTHQLSLKWPKCTYRIRRDRPGRLPLYDICGAQARHTEVRTEDVTGARVGIARCDEHRGQL